ncbi:MAG: DUF2520 domain-containing protein [Planctomycetota bacterium]|nr:DUF2520 domain-containing protein [Planctomycetota bacterium]MDA1113660.1 DUF2520 domain-containing protein [Planctomycetota bacterium]
MKTTLLIGPGRVGRSLALAHKNAGEEVYLLGTEAGPWMDWADEHEIHTLVDPAGAPKQASVIIFCVPDSLILHVAENFAASYPCNSKLFIHTSGLHDIEVLKPISLEGGFVAAMHPVMQFVDPDRDVESLRLALVTETADPNAREGVLEVAEVWGAQPVRLKAGIDRRRYHLGLALASNHITALCAWSAELLEPVFREQTWDVVKRMAEQAMNSAAQDGASSSLTGAVVRGDISTVEGHLQSLSNREKHRYAGLLDLVVDLAEQGQRLPHETADRMRAIANDAR